MKKFNIGKDFSPDPSGRYLSDGDASGERFREDFLKPSLESLVDNEKLEIKLDDGVEGYGSSFLVEGFAGIVRHGYMTSEELLGAISIVYSDEDFSFYKRKIITYIKEAKHNSKVYSPTKRK